MDASSIYSCDDHLDLNAVPRDVWESRVSQRYAEQAPHVVDREGVPTWVAGDRVLGGSGRPPGTEHLKGLGAIGRAGIEDDGFRASNPKLRLEDLDRDGVWASVIYGPVPLTLSIPEPELQDVCYAAWNDWAVEEFNASAPDRLCVLAFLPSHSPGGGRRRARALRRPRAIEVRSSTSSTSMPPTGRGTVCGLRPGRPGCPSASTSRAGRLPGSATRSASGSRRPSPRSCPCSSTRRWPP